jgi:hypothetical protein
MTAQQKQELALLIEEEKNRLGSYNKVAVKCGVSDASISLVVNGKHDQVRSGVWEKIAAGLQWRPDGWQLVEITNTRLLHRVYEDARTASLFMAVSHRAGSGKTASSKAYVSAQKSGVYLLQAREWGRREFLLNLCRTLGIDPGRGYIHTDEMVMSIVSFFKARARFRPLLIIDEADKLRPAALRAIITFYNELEEQLGMVVMGTDNLEKEIKRGVKFQMKGFDEIDSRFGRNFIHLVGATLSDVTAICEANGLTEKGQAKTIFDECEPRQVMIQNRSYLVVEDLRRVKRAVQRELLRAEAAQGEAAEVV